MSRAYAIWVKSENAHYSDVGLLSFVFKACCRCSAFSSPIPQASILWCFINIYIITIMIMITNEFALYQYYANCAIQSRFSLTALVNFLYIYDVLGIRPRASHILSPYSNPEPQPPNPLVSFLYCFQVFFSPPRWEKFIFGLKFESLQFIMAVKAWQLKVLSLSWEHRVGYLFTCWWPTRKQSNWS